MSLPSALLVGIDAASTPCFKRWMQSGKLPCLQQLALSGRFTGLLGEPLSGATWPSLYTGKSVAEHGAYFYNQLEAGSYRTALREEGTLPYPPFWELLDRHSIPCIIVDAPKTRLSAPFHGLQVINWATHDPDAFNAFECNCPDTARIIRGQFPADPLHASDWGGGGERHFEAVRERVIANIQRRSALNLWLAQNRPWQLFFCTFDDLHQLGHLTWHLHDVRHPRFPGKGEDFLLPVARAIDEAIAALCAVLPDATELVVFNSLGMGPNYTHKSLLDQILGACEGESTASRPGYALLSKFWRHLPLSIQRHTTGLQIHLRERLYSGRRGDRRWFSVPLNEDNAGIRINLEGREPRGQVSAQAYDSECAKLHEILSQVVDTQTRKPLIRDIVLTRSQLSGERIDALPDIIVRWDIDHPVSRVSWPGGEAEMKPHEFRTGSHRRGGFLITGPGALGDSLQKNDPVVSDLAPALLKYFAATELAH